MKSFKEVRENLQELSPETLDRYMAKSDASIRDLKKKARAHKDLGNKDMEKKLRQKMKKRGKSFTGAVIRHRANALGGIKLDPKSPVAKALASMPKNLLKKYGLELAHVEYDSDTISEALGNKNPNFKSKPKMDNDGTVHNIPGKKMGSAYNIKPRLDGKTLKFGTVDHEGNIKVMTVQELAKVLK